MRYPKMRLTPPRVKQLSLPPGKNEAIVFCPSVPGFGVRLRQSGRQTFVFQYRLAGKQKRVSLGRADVVPLQEARDRANEMHRAVLVGKDPMTVEVRDITLGDAVHGYLEDQQKRVRASTLALYRRSLHDYWRSFFDRPISSITRPVIRQQSQHIATSRGPVAGNRAHAVVGAVCAWAVGESILDVNPVIGLPKPAQTTSRDRVLNDDELAAIWRATRGTFGAIIRLLILTALRRTEVGGMRWSELCGDIWTIPISRSKNKKPTVVPFLPIMHAQLPPRRDHDTVFSPSTRGYGNWNTAKITLDQRSGVSDWRLHDLRRTAATGMIELGVMPHVVEAVLNHQSGHRSGVAGIYNRATYAAEKREALERWAEHVAAITKNDAPT